MSRTHPAGRLLVVGVSAACLLTVAACGPTGSGNVVTESREVGDFDTIEVSGGIKLIVTVDPDADSSVEVTYDDNLLDRVVTEVDGSTLVIRHRGRFTVLGEGRLVEVTAPTLGELAASGGTDVTGTGAVGSISVSASGGTDVDLSGLIVDSMGLEASGGASVIVNVVERIEGEASGGADVTILGGPVSQAIDVSGGADVNNG